MSKKRSLDLAAAGQIHVYTSHKIKKKLNSNMIEFDTSLTRIIDMIGMYDVGQPNHQ